MILKPCLTALVLFAMSQPALSADPVRGGPYYQSAPARHAKTVYVSRQIELCGNMRADYRESDRTEILTMCAPPSAYNRRPAYYTYMGWRD